MCTVLLKLLMPDKGQLNCPKRCVLNTFVALENHARNKQYNFLLNKKQQKMFSLRVFPLQSYGNTCESLGELEIAVETLACRSWFHSISRSPKPHRLCYHKNSKFGKFNIIHLLKSPFCKTHLALPFCRSASSFLLSCDVMFKGGLHLLQTILLCLHLFT